MSKPEYDFKALNEALEKEATENTPELRVVEAPNSVNTLAKNFIAAVKAVDSTVLEVTITLSRSITETFHS